MFGLFLCLEKWFLVFITRLFFASSFQLCFTFFSFLMYAKIRMCFFVVKCGKNSLLFSVSVLLVQEHFWAKKSVLFSTVLEITFKILFSLQEKPQKKTQPKKNIFCFCSALFLFHLFSLNIFFVHFFLSSFCSSLFDFLSFFFSFFTSPSHVSLVFFFSIAVFVYLLFVLPHFSSLLFLISFFFSYFFFTFFFSSSACFFARKNSKIFWGQFF